MNALLLSFIRIVTSLKKINVNIMGRINIVGGIKNETY